MTQCHMLHKLLVIDIANTLVEGKQHNHASSEGDEVVMYYQIS